MCVRVIVIVRKELIENKIKSSMKDNRAEIVLGHAWLDLVSGGCHLHTHTPSSQVDQDKHDQIKTNKNTKGEVVVGSK